MLTIKNIPLELNPMIKTKSDKYSLYIVFQI